MGVRVRYRDGTAIAELTEGGDELFRALPWRHAVDYPYLRYIDPYDDTFFSNLQMSPVLAELRRLAEAKPSAVLSRVLELAALCEATPRSYLMFVGD